MKSGHSTEGELRKRQLWLFHLAQRSDPSTLPSKRAHPRLENARGIGSPEPPAPNQPELCKGRELLSPFLQPGAKARDIVASTRPAAPLPAGRTLGGGPGVRRGISPSSCLRLRDLDPRNPSPEDVAPRLYRPPEESARTSSRLGPWHRPSASTWCLDGERARGGEASGGSGRAPRGRGRCQGAGRAGLGWMRGCGGDSGVCHRERARAQAGRGRGGAPGPAS